MGIGARLDLEVIQRVRVQSGDNHGRSIFIRRGAEELVGLSISRIKNAVAAGSGFIGDGGPADLDGLVGECRGCHIAGRHGLCGFPVRVLDVQIRAKIFIIRVQAVVAEIGVCQTGQLGQALRHLSHQGV